jgi:CTD small phosphatase-like protein 2
MLGRPMNKIMIVDNISNNFRLQPDNGIQIHSWYEDDDDEVLGKLYALLISNIPPLI